MTIREICENAEAIAKEFNPEGLAPFPFEKITEGKSDLKILNPTDMPSALSGAILYKENTFFIFINQKKPEKRKYFTIAHELGHYFLHKEHLKNENPAIYDLDSFTHLEGDSVLYRPDDINNKDAKTKRLETEANNFAASLIMPEKLVKNAWDVTEKNIEECADIFKVSTVAMSVRLERLGLVD